jgi:radical SAM protein with 4Fe4S-binding SPASM domain
MLSQSSFLLLSPDCFLKQLEAPHVYNTKTDQLYETDTEAFAFLSLCDGSRKVAELNAQKEFLSWCLEEGIVTPTSGEIRRRFILERAPIPSLRYLELQITARCNLECRHCYLGERESAELPTETIIRVLEEFERMQGLRLLISGGEPLLHHDFWTINGALSGFGFRSVLMTNGTLIDREIAERLEVDEVQVSLDGVGDSHDLLRGTGSFNKALNAIRELRQVGKDVSVATMIHTGNLKDFPRLEALVKELGIREWNVDLPCVAGRLAQNEQLQVSCQEAAPFLNYSFGGGLYTSSPGYACGAHLCAVMPDGKVVKCGFFSDDPVGNVTEGLGNCWQCLKHITLEELECQCTYKEECRGGCRFRAFTEKDLYAPDPVQCYLRGVRQASPKVMQ